jgi:hypothetical protein
MCFNQFPNIPNDIANNFEKNFIAPNTTTEPSTTTTTTTTTITTTETTTQPQKESHKDLNEIKGAKEAINVLGPNSHNLIDILKQTSNSKTENYKNEAKNITVIVFTLQIVIIFSFIIIIFVLIKFFNNFFK